MKNKSKTIYCPSCNRKVATYDGKSTTDITVACEKCRKLVVYDPVWNVTKTTEIPSRKTASGCRFY